MRKGQIQFPLTRRQLLKRFAGAAALDCVGNLRAASPGAGARERLLLFRYSGVKLTGGPLKEQFDRIHASYMAVNEDGLLKELRVRAGLPAPGDYLGGWYDRDGFAPGHCFGQVISGLARFAEATGDEATRAKAERLVNGFAATIAPDGYCYPSTKASTNFPAYNYDKYVVGLLDAYRFARVPAALPALHRATEGAVRCMPPRALDRYQDAHPTGGDDESYTLGENCFYAYEVTGEAQYLEMAKRYLLNATYFDPLSRGENVLPGRHAYSHCNALSSAARAYLVLADAKYLEAIRNAWDMIETTQQYASGAGARTKPLSNLARDCSRIVSTERALTSRRRADHTRTLSWPGICCGSPVNHAMATAWSAYSLTPFSEPRILASTADFSTTRTIIPRPGKATSPISGPAAPELCSRSSPTMRSVLTFGTRRESMSTSSRPRRFAGRLPTSASS